MSAKKWTGLGCALSHLGLNTEATAEEVERKIIDVLNARDEWESLAKRRGVRIDTLVHALRSAKWHVDEAIAIEKKAADCEVEP